MFRVRSVCYKACISKNVYVTNNLPKYTTTTMNPSSFTFSIEDPRSMSPKPKSTKRRCNNCSKRRRGCDKKDPCSGCRHLGISCTYSNINGDQGTMVESLMDHTGDGPKKRH